MHARTTCWNKGSRSAPCGCSGWRMGRVAEAQLAQRPVHVAWNRAARADLLIVLEDGSVHRMDVDSCLKQRKMSAGPPPPLSAQVQWQSMSAPKATPAACIGAGSIANCAGAVTASGNLYRDRHSRFGRSPADAAQADMILRAEQQAQWWRPGQRLAAGFAPQPRAVLVAAGSRLLSCPEPASGDAPSTPTLMHARRDADDITSIATLPEVRRLSPSAGATSRMRAHRVPGGTFRRKTSCPRQSPFQFRGIAVRRRGRVLYTAPRPACAVTFTVPHSQVVKDADLRNLVALATQHHVVLLDSRRPAAPLLQWAHGLDASPPTTVALHCWPDAPGAGSTPGVHLATRTSAVSRRECTSPPAAMQSDLGVGHASSAAQHQAPAARFCGLVVVCSPATGDVLVFSFGLTTGRPLLTARNAAAAEASTQRSRRRTAVDNRFPGEISGVPAGAAPACIDTGVKTAQDAEPPAFAWSPLLSADVRAGLPWRVCPPLGRTAEDGLSSLLSLRPGLRGAHDAMSLPDLQGMCLVPWPAHRDDSDPRQPLRALLIRRGSRQISCTHRAAVPVLMIECAQCMPVTRLCLTSRC